MQKCDADWNVADKRRIETPSTYIELVAAVTDQVSLLRKYHPHLPVGIAVAGLKNPSSGTWIPANLSANGMPFAQDVAKATGGQQTCLMTVGLSPRLKLFLERDNHKAQWSAWS